MELLASNLEFVTYLAAQKHNDDLCVLVIDVIQYPKLAESKFVSSQWIGS
jgi:hypothetical protein